MEQAPEVNEHSAVPKQVNHREIHPILGQVTSDHEMTQTAAQNGLHNAAVVIFCISCITFISSYLGGLVTVSVPQISSDLHLSPGMELWSVIYKLLIITSITTKHNMN